MRELSAQYPRYGYRRIRIFLGRDGYRMSPGRAYRLWRAASLQLPRKRPRKRVAAARPRPQAPCGPNQVWSYDFVFDHCANGQQLKCLTVTDEFTKEGLAIDVDGHIRSARVIEVLSRLVSTRGLDRLRQQRLRAVAQDLGQRVGKTSWLGELENVSFGHDVSLLRWRSGGVQRPHDTPPYPLTPSPSFAHSSDDGPTKIRPPFESIQCPT
jgi:transposase InsO family protein